MQFKNIQDLFSDKKYIADLVSTAVRLCDEKLEYKAFDPSWIVDEMSEKITALYQNITFDNKRFYNKVVVVCSPDCVPFPYCIQKDAERPRYILLTIIPDVPLSYELNLPIIQQMGVVGLEASELVRSAVYACENSAEVLISKDPVPPLLCNARVQWLSVYVGKTEFQGLTTFSSKFTDGEQLEGYEFDCHVIKARNAAEDPVIKRLIEMYDKDCIDEEINKK